MRYCCCGLQGLDVVVGGSGAALLNFGVWFLIAVLMVLIVAGLRLADCGLIVVWGYWCVIFLMLGLRLWLGLGSLACSGWCSVLRYCVVCCWFVLVFLYWLFWWLFVDVLRLSGWCCGGLWLVGVAV